MSLKTLEAAAPAAGSRAGWLGLLGVPGDIRAGVGELDIDTLVGADAIADIGDKHVGAAGEGVGGHVAVAEPLAAADGDGRAVHVHLAVALPVEPGPGEEHLAGGRVAGQGEGVARVAGDGAVADVRVDDLPGAATVVGDGGLAAAALVGGVAGDGHAVAAARGPRCDGLARGSAQELVGALAGEVIATRAQGRADVVVDVGASVGVVGGAEGGRALHLHVGVGHGSKAEGAGENCEELHDV